MYLQISKQYLASKENVLASLKLAEEKPHLVKQFEKEIDIAIDYYNTFRNYPGFLIPISRRHLINANELNSIFPYNLPSFDEVVKMLTKNKKLSQKVFEDLRDNNYFKEVWQINNPEYMLGNLIILIYRSGVLYVNSEMLVTKNGHQKVQISSTLEEMLACLWLDGKKSALFDIVKNWLEKWRQEGFSKELAYSINFPSPLKMDSERKINITT